MRSEVLQGFPDMSLCLFRRACTFDYRPISRHWACNPRLDENHTAIHGDLFTLAIFFCRGRRLLVDNAGAARRSVLLTWPCD